MSKKERSKIAAKSAKKIWAKRSAKLRTLIALRAAKTRRRNENRKAA